MILMIWHKALKKHASGLFELSNFNFRSTFPFENMFWSTTFTGMKKLDFRFQKMLEGFLFLPKETCWVIWYDSYQCWEFQLGTYSSHWRRAEHPAVVTNSVLAALSFSNQFSENHHFWCSWGDERLYGKSIITSFVWIKTRRRVAHVGLRSNGEL